MVFTRPRRRGGCRDDRSHQGLHRPQSRGRPAPRRRPRRRARQLRHFAKALPDTRVFYAVKANPAPEVLDLLARLGSCFDCACGRRSSRRSPPAPRPTASPSATRSRRSATSRAPIALGVRLFAVDCEAEVEKIARAAPGSQVFCRILCDGAGAEWPLSRKFGCAPEMAPRVLEHAHRLGLVAHGLSFHVGSQQRNPGMWDAALKASRRSSRISPSAASSLRCSTSAAVSRRAI